MVYLTLSLAIILFVFCMDRFEVVNKVRDVIGISREAHTLIRSSEFTDEQKESRVQQAAVKTLSLFFSISVRVAVTVLLPLALVYLVSLTGLYSVDQAIAQGSDPVFIIVSTIVMALMFYFMS